MLLVGLDTRPDNGSIGSRSDSIIIAHIPAAHDRVYLISIPRDTNATSRPTRRPASTAGHYKINAAFIFGSQNKGGEAGGFQLLAKTIKQDYGITFNGGAIVELQRLHGHRQRSWAASTCTSTRRPRRSTTGT